jgi:hypothetical protein
MMANGLWTIDGRRLRVTGFIHTGAGVHGLYPSRDARYLYATNRGEGSISVISFRTGRVVKKWWISGGGSPDMGGVSANGRVLWVRGGTTTRRLRHQHQQRAAAGEDPGRRQPARPRVAAARPLLARPHRHPALTGGRSGAYLNGTVTSLRARVGTPRRSPGHPARGTALPAAGKFGHHLAPDRARRGGL